MYYFKIIISVAFVIEFFVSLAYLLYLSMKVATHLIESKKAMRKSFLISFFSWLSMFIVYFLWQDISNWNLEIWIMVTAFTIGTSILVASISAFALWNWKK